MNILVLNAGSSSLKYRLLSIDTAQNFSLAGGAIERWDSANPQPQIEQLIRDCEKLGIDAVGHRVVHGGWHFNQTTLIDPNVIAAIREVTHLAPLHNASALAGIEAVRKVLPYKPSCAVFDTAFHRTIPDVAALYAIPADLSAKHHLRRYGFHGISHQYVSRKLLECLNRPAPGSRLITAHLGNGASLCAIRDGKSIDTSMGLTPMEGLVMGTRSGDLDPGLLLHLFRELSMTPDQIDDLLNHQSGLKGLSARSEDLRDLEKSAMAGDKRSEIAMEIFAYRIRKYIGAYAVALNGLDALAFTAGIGEHSPGMRARICRGLDFLGLKLDPTRNQSAMPDQPSLLHATDSHSQIWLVPTNEELQIATEIFAALSSKSK